MNVCVVTVIMPLSTNSLKQQNVSSLNYIYTGKTSDVAMRTNILNKYKTQIPTFNDDIQGTGIVTLGGIFAAMDIAGEN